MAVSLETGSKNPSKELFTPCLKYWLIWTSIQYVQVTRNNNPSFHSDGGPNGLLFRGQVIGQQESPL